MKEGFTFYYAILKILRKVIFTNFGGGGKQKRASSNCQNATGNNYLIDMTGC